MLSKHTVVFPATLLLQWSHDTVREATFQLNCVIFPLADNKCPQQLLGGPKSRQASEEEALRVVCWSTPSYLVQQACLSSLFTHNALHPKLIPGLALRSNELHETGQIQTESSKVYTGI